MAPYKLNTDLGNPSRISIAEIEKRIASDTAANAGLAQGRIGGNGATMPVDIREVPLQLGELRDSLMDLHSAVARIRDRIQPTLAPNKDCAELTGPPPSLSAIGEQLRSFREEVNSATRILLALETGCQL
jgi:hypothetical protein